MKITKSVLKRLIKEELEDMEEETLDEKLTSSSSAHLGPDLMAAMNAAHKAASANPDLERVVHYIDQLLNFVIKRPVKSAPEDPEDWIRSRATYERSDEA